MKLNLLLIIFVLSFLIPCFAQENIPCPNLSVNTSKELYDPGESIPLFISSNEALKSLKLEYKWKLSDGVLEEGQGTSGISIGTGGLADLRITAIVEIKGLPQNCLNRFSGTAFIGPKPTAIVTSENNDWFASEMEGRVFSFFAALKDYAGSRGVIINYGSRKATIRREAEIKRLIRKGKHNLKLIEFRRDDTEAGIRTKFFLVPKGAEKPVSQP